MTTAVHLSARTHAPLPLHDMVIGMSPTHAADLLPRVFNLCRAAQNLAGRMALGLPVPATSAQDLTHEILRDHVLKACLKWPRYLGLAPVALPRDWQNRLADLRAALFGPARALPTTLDDLRRSANEGDGLFPVLMRINQTFDHGEACTADLPLVSLASVFHHGAQENSVAARHASHPLMREIETTHGRGPFWRAVAVALDIEACLDNALPQVYCPRSEAGSGAAVVPAARGLYAVTATQEGGQITDFKRITPTCHLLAKGGVLDQSLARLSAPKTDPRLGLLMDILNPCMPVHLEEVPHA